MKNFNIENDIFEASFTQNKKSNVKSTRKPVKAISFVIDSIAQDYLDNVVWLERTTKKDYLNELIRQDLIKRLGLKKSVGERELKEKWQEFKKEQKLL